MTSSRFWPCRAVDHPTREERIVARIEAAVVDDWKAGAWLLERMHPERWLRRAIASEQTPVGADALDELAERRAARRGRFE